MVWPATNRRLAPSIQVTELIPVYLAARRGIACSQLSERKGKTTSLDQKGFNRNANRIILYTRNPCIQRAFPLPFHMDNDSYLISISVEFHWQTCRREAYKTPESSTIIRLERRSWKGDRKLLDYPSVFWIQLAAKGVRFRRLPRRLCNILNNRETCP